MATTSRIGVSPGEKLISELPLTEGLAIYLDAWKQLISTSFKALVVVGLGLVVVGVASTFLTAATVVSIASSILMFFMNFISEHPILTPLGLVVFVVVLIVLRAGRSSQPV